ncbi:MAG: DUF4340 domain-containing protein [Balneolaceae bacterium]|nr:DUF4340 domain-containing protein [Balneolaceae bacterium]
MTNATKTLSLIFAFALVLLLLQVFLSGSGESEIFKGDLVETEASQVNRITIDHPADTAFVELSKSNGAWQIRANNETFEADSQKIKTALREFQNMEVEALVTRDPAKHTRYRVDSTSATITLYRDDQQLDQLIASSSQFPGSSGDIYVRLTGDNQVFLVNGLRRSSIQSNFNYWRDLTVWNVPERSITEIRFTYPADSSFTIRRENETWFAGSDSLDKQKTSTLSNMLANLEAAGFPDEGANHFMPEAQYTVEFLLDNGETKSLAFFPAVDSKPGPFYKVSASGYPYAFFLAKRTWNQAVLTGRDDYLKE